MKIVLEITPHLKEILIWNIRITLKEIIEQSYLIVFYSLDSLKYFFCHFINWSLSFQLYLSYFVDLWWKSSTNERKIRERQTKRYDAEANSQKKNFIKTSIEIKKFFHETIFIRKL